MNGDSTAVPTVPGKNGGRLMAPWPKGVSGNPTGRRKPITEAYQALLDENPLEARKIALAMIRQAKRGNVKATVEVTDRVEGKLSHDESDSDKPTIQVIIVNREIRPHASDTTT